MLQSFRVCRGEVSVLQRIRVHRGGVALIIFRSVEARCRFYKDFGSAEAVLFTKSSGS